MRNSKEFLSAPKLMVQRRDCRGLALIEVCLAVTTMLALAYGGFWVLKLIDFKQDALGGARSVAFDCARVPVLCSSSANQSHWADQIRARHVLASTSAETATPKVPSQWQGNDPSLVRLKLMGESLMSDPQQVGIALHRQRFNAFGSGSGAVDDALNLAGKLAGIGPDVFGLDLMGGVERGDIQFRLQVPKRWQDVAGKDLVIGERLAILSDHWSASSLEQVRERVYRGQTPMGIENVSKLYYAPLQRVLMPLTEFMGLDQNTAALRDNYGKSDVNLPVQGRYRVEP